MFYQEVWGQCTALSNIIVFPEATKPMAPSLCDVLGKPIRFTEQIFVPLAFIPKSDTVLLEADTHTADSEISVFSFCFKFVPFFRLFAVTVHILGKGFVIKGLAGPSCQLSTCGFNYRIDGR